MDCRSPAGPASENPAVMMQAVAQSGAGFSGASALHLNIFGPMPIVKFGTDEQKSQWLERIASGDVVASFALTEPGAGSNPAGLRAKAVRDGDGTKVTDLLNKPGSTIVNTRDQSTGDAAIHIVTRRRDTTWLNFLLSRGARFRMDAEMIRDYFLAASSTLSPRMGGAGTKPYQPEGIWDIVGLPGGNTRDYHQDKGENLYRRSLYTFWKRMAPPPNMETFNAPSREFSCLRRERTNTPLQALVTLNDPQFVEASRNLAQRVLKETGSENIRSLLDAAARRILCRPLRSEEDRVLLPAVSELQSFYQTHPTEAQELISVGETKPDKTLNPATLAVWTNVCNTLFNMDEVLNK